MRTASLNSLNGNDARTQNGLTLIELITAVAIVGILASIGWSYYDAQKLRGYREEAVVALTTLAQLEERRMTTNGSYTTTISDLNPPTTVLSSAGVTPRKAYTVTITIPNGTGCTANNNYYCYKITATANGGQTKDTRCLNFYLDQTGKRTATNTDCWSK